MATNTFTTVYRHKATLHRRASPPTTTAATSPQFLKQPPKTTPIATTTFSAAAATYSSITSTAAAAAAAADTSLESLEAHLSAKNFRQADEETRRLLIALAGEQAVKRGYVFFSEVQFISEQDLKAIDELWRQHSDGRFGYSVQKKVWNKVNKDFTSFFIKLGWMKKLEGSEVEQFNYRAFPDEFTWEISEDVPYGHLPLTNALRGTQLLSCILSHPAFDGGDDDGLGEDRSISGGAGDDGGVVREKKSSRPTLFKPNYSF